MADLDTTSINLIDYLPDIYKEKDRFQHLEEFLQPMSLQSEEIREAIRKWAPEFDIEDCDDSNLNHLGNLYGYRPRTSVPNLEGKRRKIRYVMDLWERKGTARAYYLAGIEIDIPTYNLTDNRYTVLSLSHRGRLSTVEEAYLQDNIFHHEGVLILETGSYIHPQLFFQVFLEFLPGGFLLYIAQTVHQGVAVFDPPIQHYDYRFSEHYFLRDGRYLPPIQAEPTWWKEVDLSSPGVFLSDGYYLHDSVGYGLSDYLLPFDPQRFDELPLGFTFPEGYRGPYGHTPGRPLNLSERSYPTTDPRLKDQEIDITRDITTTDLCRVMCFFGIVKHPFLFDVWTRPDGNSQPYIIRVGQDHRVGEHTHWLFPGVEGDMSGQVIEWDGIGWSYANLTGADYSTDCYGNLYDSTSGIYTDSTCVLDATGDVYIETLPASSLNRFTLKVTQDLRTWKGIPSSLAGDMTGKVIEWDGTSFYFSCVPDQTPPCSDTTSSTCISPCNCQCGTGGTGGSGATGGTGGIAGIWNEDVHGLSWGQDSTTTVRIGSTGGTGDGSRSILSGGSTWIESIPLSNNMGYGRSFTDQLGENISFGDVLRYDSDGKLYKEIGSDSTTAPVAMALEDGTSYQYIQVLGSGFVRNDSWSFGQGEELFTSLITPGEMDTTGEIHVAIVTDSTNIIYFNPMYGSGDAVSGLSRYESSLLTGSTGYSGTHGLGYEPILRCYDSNWEKVKPNIVEVTNNDYFVELDADITSVYVVCIA